MPVPLPQFVKPLPVDRFCSNSSKFLLSPRLIDVKTPKTGSVSMSGKSSSPLRILCLHGFMQDASILRRKTGALRKALSCGGTNALAQLYYLDAPFLLRRKSPSVDPPSQSSDTKHDEIELILSPGYLLPPDSGSSSTPAKQSPPEQRSWWHTDETGHKLFGWEQSFHALLNTISEHVRHYYNPFFTNTHHINPESSI